MWHVLHRVHLVHMLHMLHLVHMLHVGAQLLRDSALRRDRRATVPHSNREDAALTTTSSHKRAGHWASLSHTPGQRIHLAEPAT